MKITRIFFSIVCILQLFYIFEFRSGFRYEVIINPLDVNAAIKYAVTSEVVESKDILNKQKIINFNLSDSLKRNTYLYQRIIEFNYPVRLQETSKFIFFLKDEKIPNYCKLLESGESLKFVKC